MTKSVRIEAHTFDSLPGHVCVGGTGQASTLRAAVCGAVRNLLKNPALKHKQFHSFKMSVVICNHHKNPVSGQEE